MEITVNGKQQNLDESLTLQGYIQQLCLNPDRVITEVNEKIVKREHWQDFTFKTGDCVELVTFVGGG